MAERQQRVNIEIPSDIDNLGRRVLGQMIIDFIEDRTARGIGIDGEGFAPYSQSYRESDDFQAAGKSSLVNLSLSGDMMASIELLSHRQGQITLGFAAGSPENDKAAWVSDFENGPSRGFLGINANDLRLVLERFRAANPETQDQASREARSIINRLLGNG